MKKYVAPMITAVGEVQSLTGEDGQITKSGADADAFSATGLLGSSCTIEKPLGSGNIEDCSL